MKYKPWIIAVNAHVQGALMCIVELIWKYTIVTKFRREIFECADGGTVLLEWLIHPDQSDAEKSTKDIMVLVPGIGGDSSLFYIKTMARAAIENGYEMVVVNY
jgi:predicted alpha/beta-fold hydrolase